MSKLRKRPAPPAFVRWLQLLFATVVGKHAPFWSTLVRRLRAFPDRPRSTSVRVARRNDFAPTQVMRRIDDGVDERWIGAGAGVDVSEQDLETLPAELREALLGDHRRARARGESAAPA